MTKQYEIGDTLRDVEYTNAPVGLRVKDVYGMEELEKIDTNTWRDESGVTYHSSNFFDPREIVGLPSASIDVSKIKPGDTVTLEVRNQRAAGTYTVSGIVFANPDSDLCVGNVYLLNSSRDDRTVVDHKPVWCEPEGWQEWDGLRIEGDGRWWIKDRGGELWQRNGVAAPFMAEAVLEHMQGKTVTRLYLTEEAPNG